MIKSEVHKGLIRRGATKLDLTIEVEQTAPMQLTVRKGTYTNVSGDAYELRKDVALDFIGDVDKTITVSLVLKTSSGEVDIWVDEVPMDGLHLPADTPSGYQVLIELIGASWFILPTGCADLSQIDIYTMQVIP